MTTTEVLTDQGCNALEAAPSWSQQSSYTHGPPWEKTAAQEGVSEPYTYWLTCVREREREHH
eukprot:2376029-Amphidinium_carterae.1